MESSNTKAALEVHKSIRICNEHFISGKQFSYKHINAV